MTNYLIFNKNYPDTEFITGIDKLGWTYLKGEANVTLIYSSNTGISLAGEDNALLYNKILEALASKPGVGGIIIDVPFEVSIL